MKRFSRLRRVHSRGGYGIMKAQKQVRRHERMLRLLMIADDFTGALDTGVQLAAHGIPTQVVVGQADLSACSSTVLVVDTETRHLSAAKAAEASVVVGDKVKKGAKVLDDKGSVAVDKGSRALGKQLGKTRGMFKAFKDEYQKASGGSSKATK